MRNDIAVVIALAGSVLRSVPEKKETPHEAGLRSKEAYELHNTLHVAPHHRLRANGCEPAAGSSDLAAFSALDFGTSAWQVCKSGVSRLRSLFQK
jgi:hypothetical protein